MLATVSLYLLANSETVSPLLTTIVSALAFTAPAPKANKPAATENVINDFLIMINDHLIKFFITSKLLEKPNGIS